VLYRIIIEDGLGDPTEEEVQADNHLQAIENSTIISELEGRDEGDVTLRIQSAE
jgi:hypothetical protein